MIRVGICSFRKTGNYLLLKIIIELINSISSYNSFSKKNNLWENKFNNKLLAYPEELEIDELVYFEKRKWQLYKGKERFDIEDKHFLEIYDFSNIILTHEPPSFELITNKIFKKYTWIYLYRDCKETINSLIHFLTSPVIIEREPSYSIDNPNELFKNDDYIYKKTYEWINHMNAYCKYKDYFNFIRYDQITNLDLHFNSILQLFNIQMNNDDIKNIIDKTSFKSMKKSAPNHVRKGKKNDWLNNFQNKQIKKIDEILNQNLNFDIANEK